MSLRSWKGFLPEKAVIMVRRAGQTKTSPSVPVGQESANSADARSSIAAITANLKQSINQSREESPTRSSKVAVSSTAVSGRVLIYCESEPSVQDRGFLLKMLAAIELKESDLVLEWGDFPEAKCPVALGIGLSPKKSNRLVSLRPDRFELPALSLIQSDSSVKREAWERLKLMATRLKEFS